MKEPNVYSRKSTPLQKWWQKRNYLKFILKSICGQLGMVLHYCPMSIQEETCLQIIHSKLKFLSATLDNNTALAETFSKNKPK